MRVVLVHGIYNTARRFKVMQAEFEAKGHQCIAPSLTPNSGSEGLEQLAEELKMVIDGALSATDQGICLVGFSMGGLVARYYLQALGGYQVAKLFVSIATPHHGSFWAHGLPTKGVRQMRPGSSFLLELQRSSSCLQEVQCFSYWTPYDLVIVPAASSIWDKADNIKVNVLAHHLMVKDSGVIGDILEKIARAG